MNMPTRNLLYVLTIFMWVTLSGIAQAAEQDNRYSIISENEFKNDRHTIDVRLGRKVSEQELRSIAMEIMKAQKKTYDRTFIAYYLPDMKVGSGAWATTHFDPDVEVKILGLTLDQDQKITRDAASDTREVVGVWADERPYVGATLTLYGENGKLYLDTKYADGSGSIQEMTETKSAAGTKLAERDGNSHGDYVLLDAKGNLQAGDSDGLFLQYKKIK